METQHVQDDCDVEFDIDVELPPELELPFAEEADVLDLGPILVI
jgi:hypothetical protein